MRLERTLEVAAAAFMAYPVIAADLLIANARIMDGTGEPSWVGLF